MENYSPAVGNLPVKLKMKNTARVDQDNQHAGYKAYKPIPNVKKFKVLISKPDKLFEDFGILKKLKPTFIVRKHSNNRLNRYVIHQFNRMSNCAIHDPIKC